VTILDFHIHVFPPELVRDRERVARNDKSFALLYGDEGARMADGDTLLRYMEEEGVASVVACGFSFSDPGLTKAVNDYILDLARHVPAVVPFCSVNPATPAEAEKEAARCLALGARGIGEVGWYGTSQDASLSGLEGVARSAADREAILMIHVNEQVGHPYKGKVPSDFAEIVRFVGGHRELKVVLAHLGGGLCFYEFMPEVKEALSSTYYDTAALPFLYGSEVYEFLDRFVPEKTLFGSDFPLLSFRRYKEGIQALTVASQERLLYGNATALLGP
jgi:hypothetical protein